MIEYVRKTDEELLSMELIELEQRRKDIVLSAQGNADNLSVDQLHELCAITAIMRGKARSGAPKSKVKAAPTTKAKPLTDLLDAV